MSTVRIRSREPEMASGSEAMLLACSGYSFSRNLEADEEVMYR